MLSSRLPARPEVDFSFLGPATRLKGSLRFSGRMRVDGEFEGEIEGRGTLELGERALTEGRIVADELLHRGQSRGDIQIDRFLQLDAGCHHRGDILARRVRINPRARLEGTLKMPDARPDPPRDRGKGARRWRVAAALLLILAAGAATRAVSRESPKYFQMVMGRLDRLWVERIGRWFQVSPSEGPAPETERQETLLREALRLENRGALAEAAERLAEAVGLRGLRTQTVRFHLAKTLARLDRSPEAIAQLQTLLRESPGHIEGRILLGDLHARAGRLREAAAAYSQAVRRDPEDVVLTRRLEKVRERIRTSGPKPTLRDVPSFEKALEGASRLLAEKRPAQAAKLLREAIRNDPDDAQLYFHLGTALAGMTDQANAIEAYEKVIELAPDWLDAYVRLGALLESTGQDQKAIALYRRAASLDESNIEMLVRIARLHKVRGRKNEAHRLLLKLEKEHPRSTAVLLELGTLMWESGKPEESKAYFQKVLEIAPDTAPALNRLAWFHAVEGTNLEKGIELSKRSLELQPDTPPYLDTLAELYFRNGQPVEAIPYIQKAIVLDPSNRYYRVQLEKFKRASR